MRRTTTLLRPEPGHDHVRNRRGRRRRGRRGHLARVRPRHPGRPGARASARRSRPARSARASATTGRSPCRPGSSPHRATPLACIADWDSTSYTDGTPHCLRRVDGTNLHWPEDDGGEVHRTGDLVAGALRRPSCARPDGHGQDRAREPVPLRAGRVVRRSVERRDLDGAAPVREAGREDRARRVRREGVCRASGVAAGGAEA